MLMVLLSACAVPLQAEGPGAAAVDAPATSTVIAPAAAPMDAPATSPVVAPATSPVVAPAVTPVVAPADGRHLTGHLHVDLFARRELFDRLVLQESTSPAAEGDRRSIFIAGGLSLLIPGAGEWYAGSPLKAALFFAIEAAAWTLAYSYDRRGDRQTADFQRFADGHWSVNRYADYTTTNAKAMNGLVDPSAYRVYNPDNTVNWPELNRLERDISGWYSHTLPGYGTQQYYELIGKYPQYFSGWNDANTTLPPVYAVVKASLPANYTWYSGERGKANDYYSTASTYVTVAVLNHVVSALDAAWTAHSYNAHLSAELLTVPAGNSLAAVPALRLSVGY
jgi:hypothetical protein